MTLQEYLKQHQMKLSTFAKTYNLDYHGLFRVKQGAVTRDEAIKRVFEQLNIINDGKQKVGEPNTSFLSQECVCIHCEPSGDIYCYYRHHLQEIEEYLLNYLDKNIETIRFIKNSQNSQESRERKLEDLCFNFINQIANNINKPL